MKVNFGTPKSTLYAISLVCLFGQGRLKVAFSLPDGINCVDLCSII
jgi:hypothetical protein